MELLMTGTQIFATHYLDASLGVTALVRDARTSRDYFVYFNRSDVDLFRGFWGGLARRVIEKRIGADGPALLREIAGRLSDGDPSEWSPGDRRAGIASAVTSATTCAAAVSAFRNAFGGRPRARRQKWSGE